MTNREERVECSQISLRSQRKKRVARCKESVAEDSHQNTGGPEQRHEVIHAVGKAEQSELELRDTHSFYITLECLHVDAERMIIRSVIGMKNNHNK